MAQIYVGTSGWMYDWNEDMSLRWYVERSGLNAVELNASFYRFPFRSQVRSWAKVGSGLRWSVKVHRSVTHMRKLGEAALTTWSKFRELMEPLDPLVDFYLLQLPPSFSATEENKERVRRFVEESGLGRRAAVEFRHASWFEGDAGLRLASDAGFTLVSVDSPDVTYVRAVGGVVYLRLHGRSGWYSHDYTADELRGLVEAIRAQAPERVYVFFNNDHWMLENARAMLAMLRESLG